MTKPKPIRSMPSLHEHLQTAIMLEHATIPAYLTAMYSLKEATNYGSALVIRSVAIEEMLHLTLAANVMNAVDGRPSINSKEFVPTYPTRLPHSARRFLVQLERFSESAIDTFMRIEHPAYGPHPQPQPDEYDTIGQFYAAIRDGIDWLCENLPGGEKAVFQGDPARQVGPEQYYGGGGKIFVVSDRVTAHRAIDEIVDQGEGAAPCDIWEAPNKPEQGPRDQAAHFYRFDEIRQGCYYVEGNTPLKPTGDPLVVDYDEVWHIKPNTKSAEFPKGSEIRALLDDFNRSYKLLLNTLHFAFNGSPDEIGETIPRMYDLGLRAQAISRVPYPAELRAKLKDEALRKDDELRVGPPWEWVPDWVPVTKP